MTFRQISFFVSLSFACVIMGILLYFVPDWKRAASISAATFVVSYLIISTVLERSINDRIHNLYKLITNLKLGKDLKEALGPYRPENPIAEAEQEVSAWANQKISEIGRLKEQAKFRKEFLSNTLHEFKTPLFAVQGYIETLQDGIMQEDPEMAMTFLAKASRNIDRLSYLINDLDEIAKLESGAVVLNIERFDIHDLINDTIEYLEDKSKSNNITLKMANKPTQQIFVKADKKKIQQVLINLVENSIKYGNRGGTTTIRTSSLFEQILVEVTDNGHGIEEKNLSRVFERFYRTDKSRSRDIGGSGLGLSIVKHIIEAHQQSVHVRSTEGIGTTFSFTLQKAKVTNG
ncbi:MULTISPECIES: sensor histidine kinase [Sphingobacterium]|uniref:histidine kinase n=1 Tax=Sphingobacterium populi TaxID=1812824 RepID=A0ABW5UF10_9SPHI|nr:ATP-binding protein [Sphingobacterium sp. CFCC 11742]